MSEEVPRKKDQRSPVRKVYDVAERAVASRAEPIAQTGGFATVLSTYMKVNRRVGRVLGKATGGILHLVNIPTASDIGKVHQHLSTVDTHIAALIRELDTKPSGPGDLTQKSPDASSSATTKPSQPRKKPAARDARTAPADVTTKRES